MAAWDHARAHGDLRATSPVTGGTPNATSQSTGNYLVDKNVTAAFPENGTTVVYAKLYGQCLWGTTVKINAKLPSGNLQDYFLKVITLEPTGRFMCEGEFESLKAVHAVSPGFVPRPIAWGTFESIDPEIHFLMAEFRNVGEQPAEPNKLAASLADLHRNSMSPTGKFGFHVSTCHAKVVQAVDCWEESWCSLYTEHLRHTVEVAKPVMNRTDFAKFSALVIKKVVPRLLLPLQAEGRVLKPCLLHGDCWDGNTAMDAKSGQAFVFDLCSFYGHNEYDTGNWRAPRHRLSNKAFITAYKRRYPVSEPEGEWDWRNLLYSLTFNIANAIHVPGSSQHDVVIADMQTLCNEFCPDDIPAELKGPRGRPLALPDIYQASADTDDSEEEDRGSEAGSLSESRHLPKPRFTGSELKSMTEALDDDSIGQRGPRGEVYATDIYDAS